MNSLLANISNAVSATSCHISFISTSIASTCTILYALRHFPLQILIQSVCETMVPKLVAEDIPLLFSLLSDVFPGVRYTQAQMKALREELQKVCKEMYLTYGEGDDLGAPWVEKVSADSHGYDSENAQKIV